MQDPYGGAYITAGDRYVAADGSSLFSQPGDVSQYWIDRFGQDAALVWAEQVNWTLLGSGGALRTPDGVVSVATARSQLQQHGYVGPSDLQSIASAYGLLKTPPPATPAPSGSATISVRTGLGGLPTPVLIGGGVLLLLLLGGRGRLL